MSTANEDAISRLFTRPSIGPSAGLANKENLEWAETRIGAVARKFLPRERVDKILVPVDFSPGSKLALIRAATIARLYGASMWLLHVIDPSIYLGMAWYGMGGLAPGSLADINADSETELEDIAQGIRGQGVDCTCVVREGSLDEQIRQVISDCGIDLLILATHAGTGLHGYALGATAERILRKTVVPVVTVSICRPLREWSAAGPSHVLYATDLSDISFRSLAYACSVRSRFSAKLTVIHVLPRGARPGTIRSAVDRLQELALVDTDIQVLFGAVGPAVCSAAVKFGADLLAVGIERHNALGEFLFGHTLLEILSAAPCPVLTIRQWK